MKDLDFDELDRAVNSLMSNVPKSEPQTDGTPEKTLDIPSTGDDKLSFDKVTEAAKKAADDTPQDKTPEKSPPAPTPVLAPAPRASAEASHASATVQPANSTPAGRRGGRFMDVVHPSADMKKPDAPKPVSRQGVTLEPLNSAQKITDVVPQKKDAKDAKDVSESAAAPVPAPIVDTPEKEKPATPTVLPVEPPKPPAVEEKPGDTPAASSDWPDPLDMMTPAAPEKKESTAVEPEPTPVMPQPETEPDTMPAPLTSPFLPDAKVEKRPLGGLASEESEAANDDISRAPMADDTKKSVDDPNKQLPADPTEVEPMLPEELSGDLMAVEADTTHAELKRAHDENAQQSVPAVAEESPATSQSFETKEPSTSPAASAEEKSVPAGPTSIPQQYKEEPSTGDQDNGSIYDTDTYHQPLSHPAPKKSGWMWVIWIVLILLVGAGGGALLYILKLV
ncbi:MAG TPA: hypothetical protein VFS14_00610 [Candidatus Saccharimonadales bacterium]|nr:hypothetical protein [Candidatus Saccharimonadales bacterium]